MKISIYCMFLLFLGGCSQNRDDSVIRSKVSFERAMNKASEYCLKRGFAGHSPEYRSCVILTGSAEWNLDQVRKRF